MATFEPGWYYAEGDPPGTVRRWNGETWIGFPIEPPSAEGTQQPKGLAGAQSFKPVAGQIGLEGPAALASVALFAAIVAYAYLGLTFFRASRFVPTDAFDTGPDKVKAVVYVAVAVVFTAVCFITWFSLAYRNLSLWHKTRRSPGWAPFVFITPFVSYRWPWDMMLELVEKSARPDRQGEINPIMVIVWWGGWILHQTLFGAALGVSRLINIGGTSDQLAVAACAVAIIGLAGAIYMVQSITAAQETRRYPAKSTGSLATA